MKQTLIAALAAISFCTSAFAGHCNNHDNWTGNDKRLHFIAGAGVASIVTVVTKDPWDGFYWGAGIGVAKEYIVDRYMDPEGVCSPQDAIATIAGAALGAYTMGKVLVWRENKTNYVGLNLKFN